MKKILLIIVTALVMTSCYTNEDKENLQKECRALEMQKSNLNQEVSGLRNRKTTLYNEVNDLEKEKSALTNGREILYIVKFEIKQGTFTLDPFEHIKNSMNAIEVEIPVNKDYYNKLSVGQDITDAFKYGSLIMDGDFSTLHMRVKNKRIEQQ
jgi:hypothetical protein